MNREPTEIKDDSNYEDLFLIFSRRVEKAVVIIVFLLLTALVLFQLLLQHPEIRYVLVRVEQLEGKLYKESSMYAGDGK